MSQVRQEMHQLEQDRQEQEQQGREHQEFLDEEEEDHSVDCVGSPRVASSCCLE